MSFDDLGEIVGEPFALLLADHEGRAVGIVEPRHFQHALLGGRPAMERPFVGREDGVQHDEMHALDVEAVPVRPIELRPIFAEVEVIVVLAHDGVELAFERRQHLGAVVELLALAELREIAAEHHEVDFGLNEIGLGDGALESHVPIAHEARALDLLDVRVRNIGEGHVLARSAEGETHHADRQGADRSGKPRGARGHHAAPRDEFRHVFSPSALFGALAKMAGSSAPP